VGGLRLPSRFTVFRSGVRVAEMTGIDETRVNSGLKAEEAGLCPAAFAQVVPRAGAFRSGTPGEENSFNSIPRAPFRINLPLVSVGASSAKLSESSGFEPIGLAGTGVAGDSREHDGRQT